MGTSKPAVTKNEQWHSRYRDEREHALRQLQKRYDLKINREEYESLCNRLARGDGNILGVHGPHEKHLISYQGEQLVARFAPEAEVIVTFPPNHARSQTEEFKLGDIVNLPTVDSKGDQNHEPVLQGV